VQHVSFPVEETVCFKVFGSASVCSDACVTRRTRQSARANHHHHSVGHLLLRGRLVHASLYAFGAGLLSKVESRPSEQS
jgi:hypothetical protein